VRYFNTTGPCDPKRHFMVPAVERLPRAHRYITRGQYFVVHAPRQSGKTTCGLSDVRDYKAASGGDPTRLGSTSPFNIKVDSIRIGDFTRDEVADLYDQHTTETGQEFSARAVDLAYYYSQGQPWLVNALPSVLASNEISSRTPTSPASGLAADTARTEIIVTPLRAHQSSPAGGSRPGPHQSVREWPNALDAGSERHRFARRTGPTPRPRLPGFGCPSAAAKPAPKYHPRMPVPTRCLRTLLSGHQ
jgi:hypothetical protein